MRRLIPSFFHSFVRSFVRVKDLLLCLLGFILMLVRGVPRCCKKQEKTSVHALSPIFYFEFGCIDRSRIILE